MKLQGDIKFYQVDFAIYIDGFTNERQENEGAKYYVEDADGHVVTNKSFPAGLMYSSNIRKCVTLLEALECVANNKVSESINTKMCSTMYQSDTIVHTR